MKRVEAGLKIKYISESGRENRVVQDFKTSNLGPACAESEKVKRGTIEWKKFNDGRLMNWI